MSDLRAVLIGPGAHAQRYLFAAIADARGIGLSAIVGGRQGDETARRLEVPWFPELDLMPLEQADVAIIATPPQSHDTIIRSCIERQLHVLCEKPFTTSAATTAELTGLAGAAGLSVAEGMMFLHHPQFHRFRDLARREVGTLYARFGFPHRDQLDHRYAFGGGALLDAAVYPVAAAVATMDKPSTEWARLDFDERYRTDVAGQAVLVDESGKTAHLEWGFGKAYVNELRYWSETADIVAPQAFSKPPDHPSVLRLTTGSGVTEMDTGTADHFVAELDGFVQAVRSGRDSGRQQILERARLVDQISETAHPIDG